MSEPVIVPQQVEEFPINLSYCRLVTKRKDQLMGDYIHKLSSAVVAVFILIFYFSYESDGENLKYLTVQGMTITTIVRLYAAVHIFLKVGDNSKFTTALNALQTFNFALEGLIFIFYWAVLAASDVPERGNDVRKHVSNVLVHAVCFFLTAIPVAVERVDFDQRFYLYVDLPYAIFYFVFLTIYTNASGTTIYNVLDFKGVTTAVYLLIALALNKAVYYIGFFIQRCVEQRYLRLQGLPVQLSPIRYCCFTCGGSKPSASGVSTKEQTPASSPPLQDKQYEPAQMVYPPVEAHQARPSSLVAATKYESPRDENQSKSIQFAGESFPHQEI